MKMKLIGLKKVWLVLGLSLILLTPSYKAISQTDTGIKLNKEIAILVIEDLMRLDYMDSVNAAMEIRLGLLNQKIIFIQDALENRDRVIVDMTETLRLERELKGNFEEIANLEKKKGRKWKWQRNLIAGVAVIEFAGIVYLVVNQVQK